MQTREHSSTWLFVLVNVICNLIIESFKTRLGIPHLEDGHPQKHFTVYSSQKNLHQVLILVRKSLKTHDMSLKMKVL